MYFEQKYLKYKNKYLNFKSQMQHKIIFNQDEEQYGGVLTSEERIIYFKLCNQLVSRNPEIDYPLVISKILEILKKEVLGEILSLKYPESQKEKMITDVEYIFSTIDKSDTNYIGKVNIVSLQCIIIFTENCLEPTKQFSVNLNNAYRDYTNLRKGNWKDYKVMRLNLKNENAESFKDLYYKSNDRAPYDKIPYTTNDKSNIMIFLITVIKFFTLDEIIISYLDNVFFCGIASNYIYADGRNLTPFEFVEHDITHGNNYDYVCFSRVGHSRENIKSFYNYCMSKSTFLERTDIYAIKFIIFLLIHETFCNFFPYTKFKNIGEEKNIKISCISSLLDTNFINRFIDLNDLGLSIPKNYRKNKQTIIEYLNLASDIYIRELKEWSK